MREKKLTRDIVEDILAGRDILSLFLREGRDPLKVWKVLENLEKSEKLPFRRTILRKYGADESYLKDRVKNLIRQMRELDEKNIYRRLGVEPGATPEDIKTKWREILKRSHPDIKNESTEEFLKIKEAYEILTDPQKRANYDKTYGPYLKLAEYLKKGKLKKTKEGRGKETAFLTALLTLIAASVLLTAVLTKKENKKVTLFETTGRDVALLKIKETRSVVSKNPYKKQTETGPGAAQKTRNEGLRLNLEPKKKSPEKKAQVSQTMKKGTKTAAKAKQQKPVNPSEHRKNRGTKTVLHLHKAEFSKKAHSPKALKISKITKSATDRKAESHAQPSSRIEIKKPENTVSRKVQIKVANKALASRKMAYDRDEEKALKLVELFTEFYRKGDVVSFLSLFSENATENGKPIAENIPKYDFIFRNFKIPLYSVKNKKITRTNNGFLVEGDYTMTMLPKNGGSISWFKGKVKWLISKDNSGKWLIKELDFNVQ